MDEPAIELSDRQELASLIAIMAEVEPSPNRASGRLFVHGHASVNQRGTRDWSPPAQTLAHSCHMCYPMEGSGLRPEGCPSRLLPKRDTQSSQAPACPCADAKSS